MTVNECSVWNLHNHVQIVLSTTIWHRSSSVNKKQPTPIDTSSNKASRIGTLYKHDTVANTILVRQPAKTHRRQRRERKISPAKCLKCPPARVSTLQVPKASGGYSSTLLATPLLPSSAGWHNERCASRSAVSSASYCSMTQNGPSDASSPPRTAATRLQLSSAEVRNDPPIVRVTIHCSLHR